MGEHYDFVVIGTGAGGGVVAHRLAKSGKRILVLERGTFLPREQENWQTKAVFLENRYHTTDVWTDKFGRELRPGTSYWVGGNTKVYGAALFRLRERDFEEVQHKDGISPAWPVKYATFEPYYVEAEALFSVHGQSGLDPTEPYRSAPYPFAAISSEPRIRAIADGVRELGCHPFPVPLGLKLNEQDPLHSACIRCRTCDGFPCLVDAKADADLNCIRPLMQLPNVTLVTRAKVVRLVANASGSEVKSIEAEVGPERIKTSFSGAIVIVACGAINSAALLLASADRGYSEGLANSSGMVGRHFMYHNSSAIVALSTTPNPSRYMKTFGINDFYFGEEDYPFPMGSIQPIGSFQHDMLRQNAPPLTPKFVLELMKTHAVPWWLMTEDLPDPNNRVRLVDGRIRLEYTKNNQTSFKRLNERWINLLKRSGHASHVFNLHAYFKKDIDLEGVGHQNGTCRFGDDPKASVLDRNCRAHDVDNLYVVDASFFPSSGAVNPSLTIIANALRVADHLIQRLS